MWVSGQILGFLKKQKTKNIIISWLLHVYSILFYLTAEPPAKFSNMGFRNQIMKQNNFKILLEPPQKKTDLVVISFP